MKLVSCLSVSLVLFSALHSFSAEEKPAGPETTFKLSDWSYGRERKTLTGSNRVTGTVKVQNISKTAVSDVNLSLIYSTGLGEKVGGPVVQKIPVLKAGESKTLNFVAEFIPVFQGYTFTIGWSGSKKEEWSGNSDVAQPEPRTGLIKGDASVVILGREGTVDKSGTFNATLHVKNQGTEVAKNVKVFVTFFDLNKNKVKDWSGTLGSGTVAGGAEEKIAITIPNAPKNYGAYTIKLSNDEANPEAFLAGGDFAGVNDVEFAHFKFEKDAASSGYHVTAECRNGLKMPADQIKLTLVFYGPKRREVKRFSHLVPDAIASGGIKSVAFDIPGLPAYEEYEQKIAYSTLDAGPAKKAAVDTAFKFENKADLEVVFVAPIENDDKTFRLPGAVRNGRAVAVKDVSVHIILLNEKGKEIGSADKTVPGAIEPGAQKEFSVEINKPFARFSFEFKAGPADGGAEKKEKRSEGDALRLAL